MKAVQINSYGGYEVLQINENAVEPVSKKGQILVEVHAASINPFDWKIRKGYLKEAIPSLPITLGGDFAGIVTKLGEEVKEFKIGDQVFGSAIFLTGASGAFAQFATANLKNTSLKPNSLNFEEAAALPLVGSSAVQALEEHIKLQSGQKILIHGGGGGIGHIAVQLAKALGAFVATTVSGDDKEFVKNLGADQAIDYKNESFEQLAKDFDAVFDTVGGEVTNKSFAVLKKGGIIVSMLGQPGLELAKKYNVTAVGQGTDTNAPHLKRLSELVDAGKIKVQVNKVFPLEQTREAFKYQEEGHPRGKVVLKIKES